MADFFFGAVPSVRRMPERTAVTFADDVGEAWPACLCAVAIAAMALVIVDALAPVVAFCAAHAATVLAVAGIDVAPTFAQ